MLEKEPSAVCKVRLVQTTEQPSHHSNRYHILSTLLDPLSATSNKINLLSTQRRQFQAFPITIPSADRPHSKHRFPAQSLKEGCRKLVVINQCLEFADSRHSGPAISKGTPRKLSLVPSRKSCQSTGKISNRRPAKQELMR